MSENINDEFVPIPGYEGLYEINRQAIIRRIANQRRFAYFSPDYTTLMFYTPV